MLGYYKTLKAEYVLGDEKKYTEISKSFTKILFHKCVCMPFGCVNKIEVTKKDMKH